MEEEKSKSLESSKGKDQFSLLSAIKTLSGIKNFDHKKAIQNLVDWDLHRQLKDLDKLTQIRFVNALLNATMVSSPIIDKFVSWLLAIIGASFILGFSNLDSTTSLLPEWSIIIGIIGAILTTIFGFMQKLIALELNTSLEIGTCLDKNIRDLSEEHSLLRSRITENADCDNQNIEHKTEYQILKDSLTEVFGEKESSQLLRIFEKAITEPVELMKSTYSRLKKQRLYASLSVLSFFVAIIGLAVGTIVILLN